MEAAHILLRIDVASGATHQFLTNSSGVFHLFVYGSRF